MSCIAGAAFFRRHYLDGCENRHCMVGTQGRRVPCDHCPDDHGRIHALLHRTISEHGVAAALPPSLLSSKVEQERQRYHKQTIAMVTTFYDRDGQPLVDRAWVGAHEEDEFFFGPPEMVALLDPTCKRRVERVRFGYCFKRGPVFYLYGRDGQDLDVAIGRGKCERTIAAAIAYLQTSDDCAYRRTQVDFSMLTPDSFDGDPNALPPSLCVVQ